MATLSERLKEAMALRNLSQTELAGKIGVKPQIVQYLCSRNPKRSGYTAQIAEALKVDPVWLATGTGDRPTTYNSPGDCVFSVPIYEWNDASRAHEKKAPESIDSVSLDGIPVDAFGVRVSDSSMSPEFARNGLLIFRKEKEITSTGLYLLALREFEEVVFRKVIPDKAVVTLEASNKSLYTSISVSHEGYVVLGRLIEYRRYFD